MNTNERIRGHMLDELIEASEIMSARIRLMERALMLHHGRPAPGLIGDTCPICHELGLDYAGGCEIELTAHAGARTPTQTASSEG